MNARQSSRRKRAAESFKSARQSSRRKRAAESFKSAGECIGRVERGMSLFAITRGQWSMIDAVIYVLDCVGRSKISLWTWTVAEYEIQVLSRLRVDDRVSAGVLVIDHGARVKNAAIIADWKQFFGPESVRYVVNHAKIATVESDSGYRLLLRGSMNLNFNPRFEQFDMTEGGHDYNLVKKIEKDLPFLEDSCTGKEVYKVSKIGHAFDKEQLSLFKGMKVWAK